MLSCRGRCCSRMVVQCPVLRSPCTASASKVWQEQVGWLVGWLISYLVDSVAGLQGSQLQQQCVLVLDRTAVYGILHVLPTGTCSSSYAAWCVRCGVVGTWLLGLRACVYVPAEVVYVCVRAGVFTWPSLRAADFSTWFVLRVCRGVSVTW